MKCGEMVLVKDIYGNYVVRFIAQCEGRFLLISSSHDHRNGYMLGTWREVIRELVAMTVPAKLIEKTMHAESTATSFYVSFPLVYPLRAKQLADLLGVQADQVQAELEDMAVRWHEV